MASNDAKAAAAKKVAAKKAAATKKLAAAKKASAQTTARAKKAAMVKKVTPAVAPRKRSGAHPPPISGELYDDNGTLSIRVGDKCYALSSLVHGHGDAELTLKVCLSRTELSLSAQTKVLLDLAALLKTFLQKRAVGTVLSEVTCCHGVNSGEANGDEED